MAAACAPPIWRARGVVRFAPRTDSSVAARPGRATVVLRCDPRSPAGWRRAEVTTDRSGRFELAGRDAVDPDECFFDFSADGNDGRSVSVRAACTRFLRYPSDRPVFGGDPAFDRWECREMSVDVVLVPNEPPRGY